MFFAGIDGGSLTQQQKPAREAIATTNGYKRFRLDSGRVRTKERMSTFDRAHDCAAQAFLCTLTKGGIEMCNSVAVDPEALLADL